MLVDVNIIYNRCWIRMVSEFDFNKTGHSVTKKSLQITTFLLGLIPLITGLVTMFGVNDPIYAGGNVPALPLLDSNLRFFGGVWFGLGVAMLWIVPNVEIKTDMFRLIWGAIFIGGVGRVISMGVVGMPPLPFVGFTILEVIGAPLFVFWQSRVAKHLSVSDL
jgi:hypothetical protein